MPNKTALKKALEVIGEIKPRQIGRRMWVFEHPAVPISYIGETAKEAKLGYIMHLEDWLDEGNEIKEKASIEPLQELVEQSEKMGLYGYRYCDVYDSYFREDSTWSESQCSDRECQFCESRPALHPNHCSCLVFEEDSVPPSPNLTTKQVE